MMVVVATHSVTVPDATELCAHPGGDGHVYFTIIKKKEVYLQLLVLCLPHLLCSPHSKLESPTVSVQPAAAKPGLRRAGRGLGLTWPRRSLVLGQIHLASGTGQAPPFLTSPPLL